MDPVSIIGLTGTCSMITQRLTLTLVDLNDLRRKFKNVEQSISMLTSQIKSVKVLIDQLNGWLERLNIASRDVVDTVQSSLEACETVIFVIQTHIARSKDKPRGIKFWGKVKHIWDEKTIHDYERQLNNQLNALGVLLQAFSLNASNVQHTTLSDAASVRILNIARDDASIYAPARKACPSKTKTPNADEDARTISAEFDIDEQLFQSGPYIQYVRKLMKDDLAKKSTVNCELSQGTLQPSTISEVLESEGQSAEATLVEAQEMSKEKGQCQKSQTIVRHKSTATIGLLPRPKDPTSGPDLCEAAFHGSIEWMKQLITNGADFDYQMTESDCEKSHIKSKPDAGSTPLHCASAQGHLEAAFLLLESGAQVGLQDSQGQTPLHRALLQDHEDVAALLVSFNAPIDVFNSNGNAPLHNAVAMGMGLTLIQKLCSRGAPVDARTSAGSTPLLCFVFWALEKKRVQCPDTVKYLLSRGADVNGRNDEGFTPLHFAEGEALNVLLSQSGNPFARTQDGKFPLHFAAERGNLCTVKTFLNVGVPPYVRDNNSDTPLHLACQSGYEEVAKALLEAGADVGARGWNDCEPLHCACDGGHSGVVRELIRAGAPLDDESATGATPLRIAYRGDKVDCIKLLLEAGADVEKEFSDGSSPLHLACIAGQHQYVDLLLAAGASVERENKKGWTPLALACTSGNFECLQRLLKAGADTSHSLSGTSLLHLACEGGNFQCVRLLLHAGVFLESINKEGWTPLALACYYGNFECLQLLLIAGADTYNSPRGTPLLNLACQLGHVQCVDLLINAGAPLESIDKDGWTPLAISCRHGNSECLSLLLKAGADTSLSPSGTTLLHVACVSGNVQCVNLLLNAGVYREFKDKDGWTPLCLACIKGHFSCVEALVRAGANVEARGCRGATVLHAAAQSGSEESVQIVKFLLHYGININITDYESGTALFVVGNEDTKRLLLQMGADTSIRDIHGRTWLEYKAWWRRETARPARN